MKLDEIIKGKEYAVKSSRYGDPRRVKVLEIISVPERRWDHVREVNVERTLRKVKVKFLDKGTDRWDYEKGRTLIVKAQDVQAPWEEVGPALRKRLEDAAERDRIAEDLEKRLKKLLGRNFDGYVTVSETNMRPNLSLYGNSFLKMLDYAEKGKTA